MNLTLGDPMVKVQLFRFIDAMPALRDHGGGPPAPGRISRRGGRPRPLVAPAGAWRWRRAGSLGREVLAGVRAVRRRPTWPGGSSPERRPPRRSQTVLALRRQRLAFTADLLGEAVISEAEAEAYQQTCLDLLRGLAGPLAAEPEIPQIDRDDRGPIPRVNLSLKLTSLTARFDALHAETTTEPRRRAAPADPADRPRAGGVRPRRHGAVRPQGPDAAPSSARS